MLNFCFGSTTEQERKLKKEGRTVALQTVAFETGKLTCCSLADTVSIAFNSVSRNEQMLEI